MATMIPQSGGGGGDGFYPIDSTINYANENVPYAQGNTSYNALLKPLNWVVDVSKKYLDYMYLSCGYNTSTKKQQVEYIIYDMNHDKVEMANHVTTYSSQTMTGWWGSIWGQYNSTSYNRTHNKIFALGKTGQMVAVSSGFTIYYFTPDEPTVEYKNNIDIPALDSYIYCRVVANAVTPYIEETDSMYIPIMYGTTSADDGKTAIVKLSNICGNLPVAELMWSYSEVGNLPNIQYTGIRDGDVLRFAGYKDGTTHTTVEININTDAVTEKPIALPTGGYEGGVANMLNLSTKLFKSGSSGQARRNDSVIFYDGTLYTCNSLITNLSSSTATPFNDGVRYLRYPTNEDGIIFDNYRYKKATFIESQMHKQFCSDANQNSHMVGINGLDKIVWIDDIPDSFMMSVCWAVTASNKTKPFGVKYNMGKIDKTY